MTITTTEAAAEIALATAEYPVGLPVGGPREDRPTRRHFSIEYKSRVLAEYDSMPVGSKGLVLRREGLYDASVKRWRTQLEAGTLGRVNTPTPRRGKKTPEQQRISELEAQVAKLEAESAKKDKAIANREEALEVLGKGAAFLEALSQKRQTLSVTAWRTWQAETATLLAALVGIVMACALVGRSRATHHRQANPKPRVHGPHPKAQHPAELTEAERTRILTVMTSEDYVDLSVAQVWARELHAGRYWCSQRTMHRILTAQRLGGERRRPDFYHVSVHLPWCRG